MRRREFITLLGGAVAAGPLSARAQQPAMPTIGFLGVSTPAGQTHMVAAFVQRLRELGWIEGRTVAIEYKTRLVLDNIRAVFVAVGLTMDQIVTTTVFLKDLNEFGKMNEVYATFFKSGPPARATVEVARLPRDVRIEISAIAVHP